MGLWANFNHIAESNLIKLSHRPSIKVNNLNYSNYSDFKPASVFNILCESQVEWGKLVEGAKPCVCVCTWGFGLHRR